MSKRNQQSKSRNYVVKKMISRSQKAGYHTDVKKEHDKFLARSKVDYDTDEPGEEFPVDCEEEI